MEDVKKLCMDADIVALQETWWLQHDLQLLGDVDDNFEYTAKTAIDLSCGVLCGRPHGGVALLWRKRLFPGVIVVKCKSERIVAIKMENEDGRAMLIMSVYMPTDHVDNLPLFCQCLGEMNAIIQDNNIEVVYMLGDFNAHPNAPFSKELRGFCDENDWICADVELAGESSDTHTFLSEAHGCTRWLDHCVVSKSAWETVSSLKVLQDTFWSDHLPIEVVCNLKLIKQKINININTLSNKIRWGVRGPDEINKYQKLCNDELKNIHFPEQFQNCADSICNNVQHRDIIDSLYNSIVSTLCKASISSYKLTKNRFKGKSVFGWNDKVKVAHRQARTDYIMYLLGGKPKSGPIYDKMYESRKIFKSRLKFCQNNQEQIRMDKLAAQHSTNSFDKFWKGTKQLNGRVRLPLRIEGKQDPIEIANAFREHFQVRSLVPPELVTECQVISGPVIGFTGKEVSKVINNMKRGKSPGHDGLSVEHLRHAGFHLHRVLGMFYTFCIRHSHLPADLMRTTVIPIVKSTSADASNKQNYRPISLATILAKVLDALLDTYLKRYDSIGDTQFGFREGVSTESAILCLKQTVEYYTKRKTPVYACFLDLSKAFDRVSYGMLWTKLGKLGVPEVIIGLLKYWYSNQQNRVRWGNAVSDDYSLECGVRQGGKTSPRLFNIYVNQLIEELSSTHTGCHIDGVCLNNLSYADDMVLLSPSIGGINKLLKICERYAIEHGLEYNVSKSEYMIFKCKTNVFDHQDCPPPLLNGVPLSRVTKFKYLGHVVTDALSDEEDIERERRALSTRGNMLAHRFARCTAPVKITLFKAFCQTFYTCGLWASFTQRAYGALRVLYNNIFRSLFRLPRYCSASGMFADARVDDFYAIMRKRVASVMHNVRESRNRVLMMIAERTDSVLLRRLTELHVRSAS